MKARAPGKLVLSGAYSVLEGAKALVGAVDRYVEADGARAAELITREVAEAVDRGWLTKPVAFDASALRAEDRKLGLGSSAAILVASMATDTEEIDAAALFERALVAHRVAQGGGSGIDVAAACFGGLLCCRIDGADLTVEPHALPDGIVIEAWVCPTAASTRDMLAAVRAYQRGDSGGYRALMSRAAEGAQAACDASSGSEFVAAIEAQRVALGELGERAAVPIVTSEVARLAPVAKDEDACFAPSGAGGGDVAMFMGNAASSANFRARAADAGLWHVPMQIGARGVHHG